MSKLVDKNNGNPFEMQMEHVETPVTTIESKPFWDKCKRLLSYLFIDGLSGMAVGLFATLIIGTILEKIGGMFNNALGEYIKLAGQFAKFLMGAGLALGMGYTGCVKGFENMTLDELHELGVNDSMIHVDFMIGTKDMSIVGVTRSGERVQIFKDGNWAF